MMTNDTENTANMDLQACLVEYEKLRDEIVFHIGKQHQNMLISLGSASVAVPIILQQGGALPIQY
jgi:hypothetical protein